MQTVKQRRPGASQVGLTIAGASACRHAVAACVATPPGRPPLLAVALKPSKKALRCVGRGARAG